MGISDEGNSDVAEADRPSDEPPGFSAVAVVGLSGVDGLMVLGEYVPSSKSSSLAFKPTSVVSRPLA